METSQLLRLRLCNQQIVGPTFSTPHDLVAHLGAVQAQDLTSALWSIGLRLPGSMVSDVLRAISEGQLIWTWTMRGTLHIVAVEDARWMLQLLAPRAIAKTNSIYRQAGLTEEVFTHAYKLLYHALSGGKQLTRKEVMELWEGESISTSNQRGYLLLARFAQEARICLGPPNDKAQTFVLFDEWVPKSKEMDRDAALGEAVKRFFVSHGPATVDDFVWWTGLTRTESRHALDAVRSELTSVTIGDKEYFCKAPDEQSLPPTVCLLPGFDEYMLGYTDRTLMLHDAYRHHVYTKNAVFPGTIVVDGQVEGIWKRVVEKDRLRLILSPFQDVSEHNKAVIEKLATRYGEFWEKNVVVDWLAN